MFVCWLVRRVVGLREITLPSSYRTTCFRQGRFPGEGERHVEGRPGRGQLREHQARHGAGHPQEEARPV